MGGILSAFDSGRRLGHWSYVLREEMKFVYGIDYKFGCVVYVTGNNIFRGVDFLNGE